MRNTPQENKPPLLIRLLRPKRKTPSLPMPLPSRPKIPLIRPRELPPEPEPTPSRKEDPPSLLTKTPSRKRPRPSRKPSPPTKLSSSTPLNTVTLPLLSISPGFNGPWRLPTKVTL